MILQVDNIPDKSMLYTNRVYINNKDYKQLTENLEGYDNHHEDPRVWLILNENWIYTASPHKAIKQGNIALNHLQISNLQLTIDENVNIIPYVHDGSNIRLDAITCYVEHLTENTYRSTYVINKSDLAKQIKKQLSMHMLRDKQEFAVKLNDLIRLKIIVDSIDFETDEGFPCVFGLLFGTTKITCKTLANQLVELV